MTINGKTYANKPLTFSAMRKLEKDGLSITTMSTRPLDFLCGYVGLCMDTDADSAAAELDAHLAGGGNLDEIGEALNTAIEVSGFFKVFTPEQNSKTA